MTVLFAQSRVSDTSLTEIVSLMNAIYSDYFTRYLQIVKQLDSKIALFKDP